MEIVQLTKNNLLLKLITNLSIITMHVLVLKLNLFMDFDIVQPLTGFDESFRYIITPKKITPQYFLHT